MPCAVVNKEFDFERESTNSTATNLYCTLDFGNSSSQSGDCSEYEVMRKEVTREPDPVVAVTRYDDELYEVMHSATSAISKT